MIFGKLFNGGYAIETSKVCDWWEIFAQTPFWITRCTLEQLCSCIGTGVHEDPDGSDREPQSQSPVWHTVLGRDGRMVQVLPSDTVTVTLSCSVRSQACLKTYSHEDCPRCKYPSDAPLSGQYHVASLCKFLRSGTPAIHEPSQVPFFPSWRVNLTLRWRAQTFGPTLV